MAAERVSGAAMRRRQRLLRAFHRDAQWQVKLELATALLRHTSGRGRSNDEYVAPAAVVDYITPAPAVYTASATAVHAAPAPVNECVASALVIECVTPPVATYAATIAPAPVTEHVAPVLS